MTCPRPCARPSTTTTATFASRSAPSRPSAGRGARPYQGSGICGSDCSSGTACQGAHRVGHEVAGDIVEVAGVTNVAVGDASSRTTCPATPAAMPDRHHTAATRCTPRTSIRGFAEYVRMPALQTDRGILRMPDSMSYEEGSFVEPLGCVVRAQRARVRPGSTVLVMAAASAACSHPPRARAGRARSSRPTSRSIGWIGPCAVARLRRGTRSTRRQAARDAARGNDGNLADLVILGTGALSAIDQASRASTTARRSWSSRSRPRQTTRCPETNSGAER